MFNIHLWRGVHTLMAAFLISINTPPQESLAPRNYPIGVHYISLHAVVNVMYWTLHGDLIAELYSSGTSLQCLQQTHQRLAWLSPGHIAELECDTNLSWIQTAKLLSQQVFQITRTARRNEVVSRHPTHILICLTWSDHSSAWLPTPRSSFYCSTVLRLVRRRLLLKKSETERLKGVFFQTSFASAKQKRRYKRRYQLMLNLWDSVV